MTDTASADEAAARRDALVQRLFLATVGTWDVLAVYLGDRLRLYRILAERGPMTSGDGRAGSISAVDAVVAAHAQTCPDAIVLTSDPDDLAALTLHTASPVAVLAV